MERAASVASHTHSIATPAFVFDLPAIDQAAARVASIAQQAGCRALYSIKALSLPEVVETIARRLDGLEASSNCEARLARGMFDARNAIGDGKRSILHLTTPGLKPDEVPELAKLCDAITFNSLTQWERFGPMVAAAGAERGLRVNPQLSWIADERYDPCRPSSKLGVPLDQLAIELTRRPHDFAGLAGLEFHTNFRATSTTPVEATVDRLIEMLGDHLKSLAWMNLGGGYDLAHMSDADVVPLVRAAERLRSEFDLDVLIEPGSTLVRRHGYLISSVVDLFESEGQSIAVLDTSVAHLAEVFEYQRPARVLGHVIGGPHRYTLAGSSCLAGDLLAEAAFAEPLELGSRVVLCDVGAYALSKVQNFNGLAPPAVRLVS
ncbi:MAG: carboxynorspermidine decarboxylase [Planctomycetia bacterium]|nr:carboxynorspermidine decarboxylase [Planctomycetia bacterium]